MDTAVVRTASPVRATAVSAALLRSPVSAGLAVLASMAALGAAAVLTAGDGWSLEPVRQLVVDLAVGLTYPVIGAVVLSARSLDRGTRGLAWVLLGSGLAAALTALTAAAALVAAEATPGVRVLAQLQSWLWVPGFLTLLTLVPLLYPDGLLRGRLWRATTAASVVGMTLLAAGVALYPEALAGRVTVTKPVTWLAGAQVLAVAASLLLVPACLLSVGSLFVRLRSSEGLRRRQVVVLLVAAAVLLVVTALQGVIPAPIDTVAQAVAVALLPVAIGVAVTRHRLYDLDVAVCRALVAASLAVCLSGLYLTVFAIARAVAPDRSALSTALAAGVTGVLVQPLARRLSAGVDRLFYGDRADPYAVSARLASRLAERGLDVAEVPQAVCDTVVGALRLGSAEIRLDVDGTEQKVASAQAPSTGRAGPSEPFPLRHRGEVIGRLAVRARPGEPALDPRDAEILATVADQAAPALAALRLHQQLQHSRESLVLAREEERLRLRRDLHDGIGATLAGLRLQVESAQALTGDPRVATLLGAAGGGVSHAVDEVRSITDSLRPPAIDDIGLGPAMALLAERVRTPDLAVTTRIDEVTGLGPAVEVAVYRIASEALANTARHSGCTRVTMRLRIEGRTPEHGGSHVVLEVSDNGRGVQTDTPAERSRSHLGLDSMRQRAEEIGGSLEVRTGSGKDAPGGRGTLVRAVIPLAPARSTLGETQ